MSGDVLKIRTALRALLPRPIYNAYLRMRVARQRRHNQAETLESVFTRIYENHAWGGSPGDYCSGSGSSERHADRYAEAVRGFIRERGIGAVVDLGCGDFVVGRRIVANDVSYVGVDLVDSLVRRNRELYGTERVTFQRLDITTEDLPPGDLCLVRQVLQHLSNAEIAAVLARIARYRYVLVTEHYPAPSVRSVPNKDKPHGADTRIYDDSAVCLDQPPFNLRGLSLFLEDDAVRDLMPPGEKLRTYLVEPHAD
ncbi:MAG: class I SAM-dependent methyltransferase [Candidatus Polarisedimenticolia bacterium]